MENTDFAFDIEHLHIGFVGLGLIGGSIAKAIKAKYPDTYITAFAPHKETTLAAMADGIVDCMALEIDKSFSDCQIIFLCGPVSRNNENLLLIRKYMNSQCLITDVGSVKGDIHAHIQALDLDMQFIGGHPMAGSERIGYSNSKAELLENAYYILTPTEIVPKPYVNLMFKLVSDMHAIPLVLSCKEHDYATAAISHLPHVISASLVNLVKKSDNPDGVMKMIAAGGFKDITRISSSSPVMWENICMSNTDNILSLLDDYMRDLSIIREQLVAKDRQNVHDFFDSAREYRESFSSAPRGPIQKEFAFFVDIPDEPGALATIVSLIAFQSINIKNIGITHNREAAEGSLRVEVHNGEDIPVAKDILEARGFHVHIQD